METILKSIILIILCSIIGCSPKIRAINKLNRLENRYHKILNSVSDIERRFPELVERNFLKKDTLIRGDSIIYREKIVLQTDTNLVDSLLNERDSLIIASIKLLENPDREKIQGKIDSLINRINIEFRNRVFRNQFGTYKDSIQEFNWKLHDGVFSIEYKTKEKDHVIEKEKTDIVLTGRKDWWSYLGSRLCIITIILLLSWHVVRYIKK